MDTIDEAIKALQDLKRSNRGAPAVLLLTGEVVEDESGARVENVQLYTNLYSAPLTIVLESVLWDVRVKASAEKRAAAHLNS